MRAYSNKPETYITLNNNLIYKVLRYENKQDFKYTHMLGLKIPSVNILNSGSLIFEVEVSDPLFKLCPGYIKSLKKVTSHFKNKGISKFKNTHYVSNIKYSNVYITQVTTTVCPYTKKLISTVYIQY